MNDTLEFTIPDGYELDKEKSTAKNAVCYKVEKYDPKPHDIVVFYGLDMRRYITLYTDTDEMYAPSVRYYDFEFDIKGEIYPFKVPLIGVKPATDFDKYIYKKTLQDNGYEYDPVKKEVRKNRWRGKLSERYWFANENGKTGYCIEVGDSIDNERYKSGNYFRTEKEAEEVAAEFRKILNNRK